MLLLVCLLFLFINLPVGKRVVKNQVQSYLRDKLKTKVIIGSVNYSLPQWLEINGVYIEDQNKDTLLFGEKVLADIDMMKLMWGNTDIQKIVFKNVFFNINRKETDSLFNYQFVLDAFAGNKPVEKVNMDTAELKLALNRLVLDHVSLRFKDKNAGTDFYASIENLDATLNKFRPDRINFDIKDIAASGIDFVMTTYKAAKKDTVFIVPADTIPRQGYGLYITAGALDIRDANVTVENKISGMYYANKVTHLALRNALFDLDQSLTTGDSVLLDSSLVKFTNPKTTVVQTPTKDTATYIPWMIKAKQVSFTNNIVQFDDSNLPNTSGFDMGHFNLKELTADISAFTYSIEKTAGMVKQLHFKDTSGFALDTLHVNFLMTDTILSARELYVKTPQSLLQEFIEIKYDSLAGITANPRNSSISAVLKNSTLAFNDLYLVAPALKAAFPPDQFANNLVHFNTELRGTLAQVYVPYLQLVGFSGSRLNAHGTLYNLTDANKFYYDLYIDNSSFRKADILKFVPPENRESLAELPAIINLRGRVTGNKESLVSDIQTSGQGLALNGRFSLKNISDPANLKYDFAIRSSSFTRDFIMGFIPPGTLPPEIRLPEKTYATGTLSGNANNLVMDLKLNGSYGLLTVKGFIRNIKDPQRSSYDLFLTTNNYDIGKLLSQDSVLGKVTGSFKLKGTGFDYKTMRSDITASVKELQYKDYNYKNAEIAANFNNGIIDSKGSINDSSLVLQYDIKANVQNEYPSVNGFVNVDTAQLQKLNLYNDTLNFSLYANIQANNLRPRNLDINTRIDSINLQLGRDRYQMDTVSLIATSSAGVDNIDFNSPFANLHANGAFDYDRVGDAVLQYVNHYYKVTNTSTVVIPEQQVTFEGVVKKHPLVITLVPGLADYGEINFKGGFASADTDSALNLTASIPYLAYQDNTLRNGNIDIRSRNERINYAVNFDTLNYAKNTFYGTRLDGSAAHDSLSINAITQDDKKTDWFGLNGSLYIKDDTYSFRLKESLLLNYERWQVAPDNYISYSPTGLIVHNFLMTSDTARIFINSRQEIVNSPIDIAIDNFNLKSIISVLNRDTLFASGILDAKMEVADINKTIPAFTGNLTITNLELMQQPLGTVTAYAAKQSENNITATLTLQGNDNDIAAKGNYYLNNEEQQFDAFVDIKRLNLASLQGFTFGSIRNATGNVYGNMNLQGKFTEPIWKGELNFDTARFTIAQLNTPFKINNQKIVFDHPGIDFSNFTVLDSLDNQMKIDGFVSLNQGSVFDLKLDINATDFILLNAPRAINNEFYGFASVDVNVSVTGTSVSPDIQGDIFVNDNSDVTIVIPERSYGKDAAKTVVRFIDRDTFDVNPPVIPFVEENEDRTAFAKFLNYNLNIEVNKNAALKIIIDPVTGDEIRVQGDAQLNAGVDPGGNLVLAGTYELDNGYYVFNYQFLQRQFNLEKGSTIVFAGEPMQARVDITASYTVNTSAKDLLDNEVGTVDPLLANAFNQKVPFKVILYLTGILSRPTIKFDIQLPEETTVMNSDLRTTIENKLSQIRGDEAATAKQVFSLLLLGRFVGEQSSDFFKGNGNDFTDLARQSVSQFLSGALNEIAGNLLKGVDIDLNLNSYTDYSDGGNVQRTDLNVALSKTFLDDRLTVGIGKNFGVQGQDAAKANNNFIPDITIGYKLTKDGKYLLKAYRKNQFEVILDGYVVETGIGFIVTMDYDKFNELFRRKKK
ncbi:MAG TPA: translocation/assembly module TamB domain-containing protein [Ferruginibacter sp.]|nr:translocation/assembly module TamB domain-containing protein [Ferruginibacter sp.]